MYAYMYLWSAQWVVGIMGCRNSGPSEQWVIGIMGCRNNGSSQLWSIGITSNRMDLFFVFLKNSLDKITNGAHKNLMRRGLRN